MSRLLGRCDDTLTDAEADVIDEIRDRLHHGVRDWIDSGGEALDLGEPAATRRTLVAIAHLLQDQGDAEDMSWVLDELLRSTVRAASRR